MDWTRRGAIASIPALALAVFFYLQFYYNLFINDFLFLKKYDKIN